MIKRYTNSAVLGGCLFLSVAAHAGSVNQPGFTTGVPVYGDFPEGLYLTNIPEYGVRDSKPSFTLAAYTPFFFFQSPFQAGPFNIALVASPIFLAEREAHVFHTDGLYNSYGGVQFTHQFGNGWGAGFRLGGFVPQHTSVGSGYGTFDTRFGVTYLKNGIDFTVNGNYGHPVAAYSDVAPDYLNLDITATKTFGKFEFGLVSYSSTDLNKPAVFYQKQGQSAIGPVVGYNFGRINVQFKFTTDIAERNYGGYDRRVWANITIPLWTPSVPPPIPLPAKP